jgi:hypothetical protein
MMASRERQNEFSTGVDADFAKPQSSKDKRAERLFLSASSV